MPASVIALPVHNQESMVLNRLPLLGDNEDETILVIDDGSDDSLGDSIQTSDSIHYLKHDKPLGYGGSVMSAIEYAAAHSADTLYLLDISNEGFADALTLLKEGINNGNDLVSCSRFTPGASDENYSSIHADRMVSHYLADVTGLTYADFFSPFKAIKLPSIQSFVLEEFDESLLIQLWIQAVYYKRKTQERFCSKCSRSDGNYRPLENDSGYYINFIKGEVLIYPI